LECARQTETLNTAAATDGTNQLRYVATEDIKPLVKARRETSEEEYITFMRARFGQTT
jgi:hypothetical protein